MSETLTMAANAIENVYDEAIERLSRDREEFLQWKDNYGLNSDQIDMIHQLVSSKGKRLTGDKVYKVKVNLDKKMNSFFSEKTVKNFWKKQKKQFNQIFQSLHEIYQSKKLIIDSKIIKNP